MTECKIDLSRLIINNKSSNLSDIQALKYVGKVIEKGKISNGGKQYCYLTIFEISQNHEIFVSCRQTKKGHSFTVWDRIL